MPKSVLQWSLTLSLSQMTFSSGFFAALREPWVAKVIIAVERLKDEALHFLALLNERGKGDYRG